MAYSIKNSKITSLEEIDANVTLFRISVLIFVVLHEISEIITLF